MIVPVTRSIAPDASILIPVRNEAAVLRETAHAILAQRFGGVVEFLFIDGRSTDGSRELLEALAGQDERVRVIDNPRGDLASALVAGLTAARGEYVAKMDAHTVFQADYVQLGVERLRRGDVNWVTGPQIPLGRDAGSQRVALALGTWLGAGSSAKWPTAAEAADEHDLDTSVFCGVWRRSVLEALGGWDPDWPVNEDSELAARFLAAGERIVCMRGMGAQYVPRNTLRGLARQYWRYGQYRAKTARRHPGSLRRSHVLPSAVVVALAGAAAGGSSVRRVATLPLVVYAVLITATSARVAREAGRDAAWLPVVLLTMHTSWGAGMLAGSVRFGPPLRALARLTRSSKGARAVPHAPSS